MAQVTFTGNKAKVPMLVNGEHVTVHFRQWRDKNGKVRRAIGGRQVLTSKRKTA